VVFLSLLYFGLGGAAVNSLYQRLTESSGHVQVRQSGWRDATRFEASLINDGAGLRATTTQHAQEYLERPIVVGVLDAPTLLSGARRSRGVTLHGQDWPTEIVDRRLAGGTFTGSFLEGQGGVVLGQSLADALDVQIGDDVWAYAPGGRGFGAAVFTLVGTVDMPDTATEVVTAWVTLEDAQALAAPGALQRLEIHGANLTRLDQDTVSHELAAALSTDLGDLAVATWRQLNPSTVRLLSTIDPMLFAVSVLFFVLAGLLVLNTVYLSVMERIREFGVIHALGASGGRVLRMVALESVLMAGLGTAVGTAAGLTVLAALSDGFRIPGLESYYASFGMTAVWYPSVDAQQVVFAVGFAFLTALAAALWPAWLASRLEPVEAMRFQV
jgi:ABC-type lipoprotein release transport system permease subunit